MRTTNKMLPIMMITLENDGCHRCLFVDYNVKTTCRLIDGVSAVYTITPDHQHIARPDWCPLLESNVFVMNVKRSTQPAVNSAKSK